MATKKIADWQLSDAQAAAKGELPQDYEVARRLIEENDAWQEASLWPGHRTGDGVVDAALQARIKPQFISDDVAGELVENRSAGLTGQEADITLALQDENSKEDASEDIEIVVGALAHWWDRKKLWEKVGQAVDSVSTGGRGEIRAYVASGNLRNGALPTGLSLADALNLIELEYMKPTTAIRYTDPLTQRQHAVILTKVQDEDRAEIWSVDPVSKLTVVKVLGAKDGAKSVPLDLKGRLPLAEARGKRIITPSVIKLQALVNFIMTVTGRTVETAGFRSVHVTNAEPQLLWLDVRPTRTEIVKTQKDANGVEVLWGVRVPPMFGAGILHEWQGLEIPTPADQPQEIKDPTVMAIDPVDTNPVLDACDSVALRLYKRGKQGHLGLAKIGEASGTAYQQARAQFAGDLDRLAGPVAGMIRDLLEVVLAYAGLMSTEATGLLDRFRVVVILHPSAGPVTPDDARLAVELRDKRAIAQQTLLARVGIEDPAAEQDKIDADPLIRAQTWQAIGVAMTALVAVSPEMTLEAAGFLLGLTEEQITVLATGVVPKAEDTGATGAPQLSAA
jgi:hypothetical protein